MNRRTYVALVATLMSTAAWGQEVSLYGTTMAQMWKENTPGFDKSSFTPATQYLGIDATKLGSDNLSLHLFGWGQKDLGEASRFDGTKSGGYLNYGYLRYRFDRANAEIKAGRFSVNQTTGWEQVDGISGKTDLVGGLTVSAFAGRPVVAKVVDPQNQTDYNFQHDMIFGARLAARFLNSGEVGLSYLQDGTKAAQDLTLPSPVDYTRKRLGADVLIIPVAGFDFHGRTVFNVANERTNVAEHDYTAVVKVSGDVTASVNYAERNYLYLFAGTNLPSLFRQDTGDLFKGYKGSITWNTPWAVQAVADFRHTHRASYGDTTTVGGELRWANSEKTMQAGAGGHFVNAAKTLQVDATAPYRSLKHAEARVWGMVSRGQLSGSLDGIVQRYSRTNPYLSGLTSLYEVVGSLGYQATTNLKVSGDLSYGSTAVSKNETRGLLRAEYRFGFARKGGR